MAMNLVFFNKKGHRKDLSLREGVTLLGRRPDCDLRIPLGFVSRKHCRIIHREEKTMVQDLGSANGTYVNSQRIMEAVIKAGDQISVGPVIFTVQVDGVPEKIEQPPDHPLSATGTAVAESGHAETSNMSGKGMSKTEKPVDLSFLPEDKPLADVDESNDKQV